MKKNNQKCLILTMKLGANYGGIIQAYALQSFIKKMGLKTATSTPTKSSKIKRHIGDIKRAVFEKNNFVPNIKQESMIFKNTNSFIKTNIDTVNYYNTLGRVNPTINSYQNIIVGSDQVWRANYVNVKKYMLDGISNETDRISYAASFGIDNPSEYSNELIEDTKKLAKRFKSISVREDSGIDLCNEMWGIQATQNIDPTLLISKDEYLQLIKNDNKSITQNNGIFAYVLDRTNDKNTIIRRVEKILGLSSFEIMPPACESRKEFQTNQNKFVLPPVTQWLKSFDDAEFVVTDSFHGCVFSIIFNKPFIAIGNKGRGLTRFISLLKLFKLENRLILNSNELADELIKSEINWGQIREIITVEQKRSLNYLTKNLKTEAGDE